MSTTLFNKLVHELCDLHKLDVAHVLAGGAIEMSGVPFCLLHDSEADSPLLTAYCDFGIVPKNLEAEAYKQLLAANLAAYTGQGETFCLTPDGHVILANSYLLESFTAELLTGFMAGNAILAKKWQTDYFLEKAPFTGKSRQNDLILKRNASIKT